MRPLGVFLVTPIAYGSIEIDWIAASCAAISTDANYGRDGQALDRERRSGPNKSRGRRVVHALFPRSFDHEYAPSNICYQIVALSYASISNCTTKVRPAVLSRGRLSTTTRHIARSMSGACTRMKPAASANGARVRCLAGCARRCGAMRARRSSGTSWQQQRRLAHTGIFEGPLHTIAPPDPRRNRQQLP